jgi:hypothetical protein
MTTYQTLLFCPVPKKKQNSQKLVCPSTFNKSSHRKATFFFKISAILAAALHDDLALFELGVLHCPAQVEALRIGNVLEEMDALAKLCDLLHLLLSPLVGGGLEGRLAPLPRLGGARLQYKFS